ncbi:hypothetical protein HEP89_19810 [Labrenzia sp. 5N]|uniref:hypothetical protein n=1 Tax=Labrenzia sp. 5N TaxID=2723402 RepID=UPI001446A603|nr:hypothetical protein [Labrenzia sp. 5N]NKX66377.1 hypothetical protein [Labrenzia sp. 5N]
MSKEIQEDVPWSESITQYDLEHFSLFMNLLSVSSDGANELEIAQSIFELDLDGDPEIARKMVRSHLDRANWILLEGYKELFTVQLEMDR